MTANEEFIAMCNAVADPIRALEIVSDESYMLNDSYYQELTRAIWRMVDRIVEQSKS